MNARATIPLRALDSLTLCCRFNENLTRSLSVAGCRVDDAKGAGARLSHHVLDDILGQEHGRQRMSVDAAYFVCLFVCLLSCLNRFVVVRSVDATPCKKTSSHRMQITTAWRL